MRIIKLREPAYCADCGAYIGAGVEARYYGRDRIYCVNHDRSAVPGPTRSAARPPGPQADQAPQAAGSQGARGQQGSEGAERASICDEGELITLDIQFLEEIRDAVQGLIDRHRE